MMNITPDRIYEAVAQTIKGQDEYVKTLATLAWLQMLRYKNRKVNNGRRENQRTCNWCIRHR